MNITEEHTAIFRGQDEILAQSTCKLKNVLKIVNYCNSPKWLQVNR